jgi:hypothetical protein
MDFEITKLDEGGLHIAMQSTRQASAQLRTLRDGIPMDPRRMANMLNTKPELLREFCGHFAKPGEAVVLFADGRAVEIPVF